MLARPYAELWNVQDVDRAVNSFLDVPRANEMLDWLESVSGQRLASSSLVLEIGCGMGVFSAVARKCGAICYATDPVVQAAYGANKLAEANSLPSLTAVARGEQLPFPSNSFDAIVSFMVLEHSSSPQDLLLESLRLIRPGGTIMHVLPNHNFPYEFHFDVPWLASLLPKSWAKAILPSLTRKDRDYVARLVDELHWEITPKLLTDYLSDTDCQIVTFGQEFWRRRLREGMLINQHTEGFAKALKVIQKLRLVGLVERVTVGLGLYYPIALVLRK